MACLKLVVIAVLASLASAQLNVTLNADETGFEIVGLKESISERVINGALARSNEFPWHATIYVVLRPQTWNWCSGALISNRYVLTHASSVKGSHETRVFLGSTTFGQGEQIFSNQLIVHPRYNKNSNAYNIAIVRLNEKAELGSSIRPIALPTYNLVNARFYGQFVKICGYGSLQRTNPYRSLQCAKLRVTNSNYCQYQFPGVAERFLLCAMSYQPEQTNAAVSSGRPRPNARTGYGDIGSPLVWKFQELEYLVGLVADGTPNNPREFGLTGFLNVGTYTPWIKKIISV